MKPVYQFTFDQLTIGDVLGLLDASAQSNVSAFVRIADRYTSGGLLTLPYRELKNAVDQFAQAFVARVQETDTQTPPDVARLLRQALGGGGEALNER